jgi:hypothetical protein
MCAVERDACRLTRELTNQLVGVAALLARAMRRLPPDQGVGRELHAIDHAFAEPIELARKLSMAVHEDHGE